MYTSKYEAGHRIYAMWDDILDINLEWLFESLSSFGCEIDAYISGKQRIDLICFYPHNKLVKIKKFINDKYPCVDSIAPTLRGMTIYFKININIDQESINIRA